MENGEDKGLFLANTTANLWNEKSRLYSLVEPSLLGSFCLLNEHHYLCSNIFCLRLCSCSRSHGGMRCVVYPEERNHIKKLEINPCSQSENLFTEGKSWAYSVHL
jgi:hypothetical protein